MKKTIGFSTLISLSFSMSAFAMGLGQLTVFSSLDEPFNAEIELIDVGSTPLSGIKASLAPVDEFERLGLDRAYALGSLRFTVEKKPNGKAIVTVRSLERMKDPFLQLLVDLSWAEGQIDRTYTVLLDPPHYQLSSQRVYPGDIGRENDVHRIATQNTVTPGEEAHGSITQATLHQGPTSYGPTLLNETIWQVAQRYKSDDVLLQQMILAIVGMNPPAFTEGNLNGLKQGVKLQIPSHTVANQVPASMAEMEVQAHDKAWQNRQPIQHVLLPPYLEEASSDADAVGRGISVIPPVPLMSKVGSVVPSLLSGDKLNSAIRFQGVDVLEKDLVLAAVDVVRRSNIILTDQIKTLKQDNQRMVIKLAKRERELSLLRKKLRLQLTQHSGVRNTSRALLMRKDQGHAVLWLILLSMVGIVAAIVYKGMQRKTLKAEETEVTAPAFGPMPPIDHPAKIDEQYVEEGIPPEIIKQALSSKVDEAIIQETHFSSPSIDDTPEEEASKSESPVVEAPLVEPIVVEPQSEEPLKKPSGASNLLEFELTPSEPEDKASVVEEPPEVQQDTKAQQDEMTIDFVNESTEPPPTVDDTKPIKSTAALETLLSLANTYISMGDEEAAIQSLEEVIQFGSEKQKEEASALLLNLQKKAT